MGLFWSCNGNIMRFLRKVLYHNNLNLILFLLLSSRKKTRDMAAFSLARVHTDPAKPEKRLKSPENTVNNIKAKLGFYFAALSIKLLTSWFK